MVRREQKDTLGSPDWVLLGATVALVAVGLLMVFSSTSDWGYRNVGDQAHYLKRQLLWLAIGGVAMVFVAWFDYRHWTKLSIVIMAATILMLVILVLFESGRQLLGKSVSPVELAPAIARYGKTLECAIFFSGFNGPWLPRRLGNGGRDSGSPLCGEFGRRDMGPSCRVAC